MARIFKIFEKSRFLRVQKQLRHNDYCRLCGKILSSSSSPSSPTSPARVCAEHDALQRTPYAVLGQWAIEVQDLLQTTYWKKDDWWLSSRRVQFELPDLPFAATESQQYLWMLFCTLYDKCEHSLYLLGGELNLFEIWKTSTIQNSNQNARELRLTTLIENLLQIKKISECKFLTGNLWHCIFIIALDDGSEYALDPTGCQFGPDSPLLCPWGEYKVLFVDRNRRRGWWGWNQKKRRLEYNPSSPTIRDFGRQYLAVNERMKEEDY